ncbi:MAG: hypothetical protein Q7T82_00890 [Armatimonadota bacterium]|nr:hypothetical protein [Armatimonadota bacterium]
MNTDEHRWMRIESDLYPAGTEKADSSFLGMTGLAGLSCCAFRRGLRERHFERSRDLTGRDMPSRPKQNLPDRARYAIAPEIEHPASYPAGTASRSKRIGRKPVSSRIRNGGFERVISSGVEKSVFREWSEKADSSSLGMTDAPDRARYAIAPEIEHPASYPAGTASTSKRIGFRPVSSRGLSRARSSPAVLALSCCLLAACIVILAISPVSASPVSRFAVSPPLAYWPGWGYYVNPGYGETTFGDPAQATGAPTGEGTNPGGNPEHVTTLGAFGGSVTLKFDHTVRNDPNNPFGMDAIVYGNAFRSGSTVWMEAGTIEISRDANGNGLADDPWYIIPGSHISGAPSSVWATKEYDKFNTSYPPLFKSYYPDKTSIYGVVWYPDYPDHVTLGAYRLPISLAGSSTQTPWGYADCYPTLILGDMNGDNVVENGGISPEEFYTTPDDPMSAGFTPRSGGGNAFDIDWATDASGNPANLDGFDFLRITSAVDTTLFGGNECSPDIDGVADASPVAQSVRAIKNYSDGNDIRLELATVTAAFAGEFYVQDGRFFGVKVKSPAVVTPGDRVNVIGSISTAAGERFICSLRSDGAIWDAFARVVDHVDPYPPAGMPNALLGGAALCPATPGVTGGVGVNNIGVLVRTWGKVESTGAGCFYISDGSLPQGQGLKVSPGTLSVQNPRMVIVTGVSSCERVGNDTIRVIRPLLQDGIVEIE